MELKNDPSTTPTSESISNQSVPLLARVYLKLGTWKWELAPALDDESIQGNIKVTLNFFYYFTLLNQLNNIFSSISVEILAPFRNATQCAAKWGKAWHSWALFNTAAMSYYTLRDVPDAAAEFVVSAINGYFHSIASRAHAKGADDSLQVS